MVFWYPRNAKGKRGKQFRRWEDDIKVNSRKKMEPGQHKRREERKGMEETHQSHNLIIRKQMQSNPQTFQRTFSIAKIRP